MTTTSNVDPLPDGTHIGQTALRVSDLGEMSDFYQEVVGLRILSQSGETVTLGVAGTPLLVLELDETAPERSPSGTGLYHNAFRVPSRDALGDALSRVREHWQLDGASDHHVSEALYLTDPEENGVELYRDFPRKQWPLTDDGRVQMGTDPLDLERIESAADGASRAPPGTDIGHVHLEVSSLDAFEEFYVDTLGFQTQTTFSGAAFVSAGSYHHHIGANTWHHRTTPVQGRGLSWFEIVVPEADALLALRERLVERDVSLTESETSIAVTDSDGIEIRLRGETPIPR